MALLFTTRIGLYLWEFHTCSKKDYVVNNIFLE